MPFPYNALLPSWHVLVVEDSYLVAQELNEALEREVADVVGPVPNLDDARCLVHDTSKLDAAILDVNLGGEMIWPVADLLARRGVRPVSPQGMLSPRSSSAIQVVVSF